jgi:hypothetical protein
MYFIKTLISIFALTGFASVSFSQGLTTSAINGRAEGLHGKPLPGATVVAVHVPSGTVYETTARLGGYFNLPYLQPGGPYTLSVSLPFHRTEELTGIRLYLGDDRYHRGCSL